MNESIMVGDQDMILCSPNIKFNHVRPDFDGFLKRLYCILPCQGRGATMGNDHWFSHFAHISVWSGTKNTESTVPYLACQEESNLLFC